ncbi:MAG: glycosyltransferase family 39 protein [Patescibacteria group bacterium]
MLPAIVVLAGAIRLWGLPNIDLQGDAALYAFRAFGWFDFLTVDGQTSPIVWFGNIPWWGNLSFHDAPPLVMALQYLSFRIWGASIWGALMPHVLAGLGVTILLYFLIKKFRSQEVALLTSFLFAISSYTIWACLTGYLEGVEAFFIILSVSAWLYFVQSQKKKYLFIWAASTGGAILCKYTAIFLLPAVFLYILFWQRKVFKLKEFWLSMLVLIFVLFPIIIYNIFVFKTRGHFDAALSSMVGMHPEDFSTISSRSISQASFKNIYGFIIILYYNTSLPLFILYLLSLFYSLYKIIKRKGSQLLNFIVINILLAVLLLSLAGISERFLSFIVPFFSIITALFIFDIWHCLGHKQMWRKIFFIFLLAVFSFELFYAFNTNILKKPLDPVNWLYASSRFYNKGFDKLDYFVKKEFIGDLPNRTKIKNIEDLRTFVLRDDGLVLLDERLDWFSSLWYFDRYKIYHDQLIFDFTSIYALVKAENVGEMFERLNKYGIKGFWFIYASDQSSQVRQRQDYKGEMEIIKNALENMGIKPIKEITDYKGTVVFQIYKFNWPIK